MHKFSLTALTICAALLLSAETRAQQPASPPPSQPPSYGTPITLEQAIKAAAAAREEAKKNNLNDAIAVVEPNGDLVYFERADGTQYAGAKVAQAKATAAALFRRPTKSFADRLAAGDQTVLVLPGALAVAGGVPIVVNGKIIGAIGISGGSAAQDDQVATAGANAFK
jgi:glc operon protein GlcG